MEGVITNPVDLGNRIKLLTRAAQSNAQEVKTAITQGSFAFVKGRMFERWVDYVSGSARTDNGYDTDDLIECPPYIIESLLRDENFVERDLTITTVTDVNNMIVSGLKSSVDDYYNYALYFNATRNHKTFVSDYTGSSKTLTLYNADTAGQAGDNIVLTNVQGDLKIDFASFDAVGNTTNGTRKDWVFARSYTSKSNIRNILDELCFDSHCELVESVNPDSGLNQFKLVALDSGSGDTWTNPAYADGLEQATASLTPLENVFTQFRLRYFYDYGKGGFIKEIYVDKNSYPTSATILSVTEQTLCTNAETNYQISRLFEFSSMNIYDDTTAERFLQKKIQWFTKQRMIVNYVTPIVGNSDYIKYEIGDQVKLNFSKGIPTGINNTSMFMITSKRVTPLIGGGHIVWELLEL